MENKINHPVHYGGKDNPFEPIKIIEYYDLNFMLGNCIKYVLRAGKKGNKLEDLEKALWNLQREIDNMKNNHPNYKGEDLYDEDEINENKN